MSTGTRVSLATATAIATELRDVLAIGAERIEVAGSIRRGRPDVGDIELVAVPKRHPETRREGLFEERTADVDELAVLVDTLILDGRLAPHPDHPARGERYAKLVHPTSGLQVDLFSADRDRFGLIFLIRTGPAAYSEWLVTEARHRAHHVKDGALHTPHRQRRNDDRTQPLRITHRRSDLRAVERRRADLHVDALGMASREGRRRQAGVGRLPAGLLAVPGGREMAVRAEVMSQRGITSRWEFLRERDRDPAAAYRAVGAMYNAEDERLLESLEPVVLDIVDFRAMRTRHPRTMHGDVAMLLGWVEAALDQYEAAVLVERGLRAVSGRTRG